ncbi:tyrosine--tRNA ligase [Candidatus Puniceispirillum sp.]|nr:tyrosine--tRNA ligase [Candidatus Puniceispirillum sp.]
MTYKSNLMKQFNERSYIHQATDIEALDAWAADNIIPSYIGFDCTADSLHVGSLVQIMMLRLLQKCGHKPIVLMGGGTTKIGDPSGKDSARPLLSDQDIEANKRGIKNVFKKYLTFGDGPSDALMVDNADWLDTLQYIRFLRDYGSHFSVNRMMSMDSVKLRLDREQPLSFLEFNYVILQAYDFIELRRRYGCQLQMGGSDQWGNIITGIDLARRVDGQEIYGLTSPLITTSSGTKMGKSASGAIWLNEEKLSSFDFWQFWRNTEDGDVERFLSLFTELPIKDVRMLGALKGADINDAKIILADEATHLCHGKEAAEKARATAKITFNDKGMSDGLHQVTIRADAAAKLTIVIALNMVGFAKSKGDARRLVQGGGARINDNVVTVENENINLTDFKDGKVKISAGKKRHALIVIK